MAHRSEDQIVADIERILADYSDEPSYIRRALRHILQDAGDSPKFRQLLAEWNDRLIADL